jgi:hypothetical protein
MHIDDDHRHYGSAIIQVAEDPRCTAIRALRQNGGVSRCGFRIGGLKKKKLGLFVKYRSTTDVHKPPLYNFPFSKQNLRELEAMRKKRRLRVFLALVCVKARQICCLPYEDFRGMIDARRAEMGKNEFEYVIKVVLERGCQFRVAVGAPKRKGMDTFLEMRTIPRDDFPGRLFLKA